MAIGELLDLVDAGRNRVYTAEEVCDELRKRVAELERGEYICRKCGLRKDADKAEDADF